jgi:hypothetical protein
MAESERQDETGNDQPDGARGPGFAAENAFIGL